MIDLLDMVKADEVEIETPMDAVKLMIERMGVREEEMQDVVERFLGEDNDQ